MFRSPEDTGKLVQASASASVAVIAATTRYFYLYSIKVWPVEVGTLTLSHQETIEAGCSDLIQEFR